MDFKTAAGFAVTYGTSHVALAHRGKLKAGETLLIHGASGGVGLAAVELGKLMGAKVIATASSQAKLELCNRYGADFTINYQEEDFVARVKEITEGKGADVILDPVGGSVFEQSLRCIAWEGRLLVVGFASGSIPQVPANITLVKNCSVVGVYWGAYAQKDPKVLMASLQQLFIWHAQGELQPFISKTYTLEQAPQALTDLMERRAMGKLVLEL
jgi:NADPH2:quinone reductase